MFVAHVGEHGVGYTGRRDRWWLEPLLVGVGLAIFVMYSTWVVLANSDYSYGSYLSPFYSPLVRIRGLAISPAVFVLWVPLGFRLSCYYYRKAYYRAYFLSPPACAVSEREQQYYGEVGLLRWLPILHRWFLYPSIVVLAFLWYDAIRAFDFSGHIGIGLGSLLLVVNAAFLTAFTLGCHALRSLVGGNQRCLSCGTVGSSAYAGWKIISRFNRQHPLWAWLSLYMVAIADAYVRLLAMGVIRDPRLF